MRRAFGLLGLAFFGALTLAGFAARLGHPWELFVHFRPHYAALALLLAGLLLLLRQQRLAAAGAIIAAVNMAAVMSTPLAPRAPAKSASFKVLWLNSGGHNGALYEAGVWAKAAGADLVLISELRPDQDDDLAQYFPDMPHRHHRRLGEATDLIALTRAPAAPRWRDGGGQPDAIVSFDFALADGAPITVTAVHPNPPTMRWMKTNRDNHLHTAFGIVAQNQGRQMLVGDFNATPWSPILREGTRFAGLRMARCGGLDSGTFLSRWVFLGLPIDLAYVSAGLAVRCAIAPARQSEHFAVLYQVSPITAARAAPR
jgi:endonuclease/exonuclease/phosphatase (EEP) superfamily protein YafD